jgi:hypothetical protein
LRGNRDVLNHEWTGIDAAGALARDLSCKTRGLGSWHFDVVLGTADRRCGIRLPIFADSA